jgi:hypothetical protein
MTKQQQLECDRRDLLANNDFYADHITATLESNDLLLIKEAKYEREANRTE